MDNTLTYFDLKKNILRNQNSLISISDPSTCIYITIDSTIFKGAFLKFHKISILSLNVSEVK